MKSSSPRTFGMLIVAALAAVLASLLSPLPAQAATPRVTPGSDIQTLQIATAGTTASLSFAGRSGQIPTVEVADGDTFAHAPTLSLVKPNGTVAASQTFVASAFHAYPALTSTGTWSLRLTPARGDTGTLNFLLSWQTAKPKPLSVGKKSSISFAVGGTVQAFTFTGRVGQRPTYTTLASDWTSATGETQYPTINAEIFRPDGSNWGYEQTYGFSEGSNISDADTLDVAGTYTLVFRSQSDTVGTSSYVFNLVTDQVHAITSGVTTTLKVTTPGQNAKYTFHGVKGQHATLDVLGRDWQNGNVSGTEHALIAPDGSTLPDFGLSPGDDTFPQNPTAFGEGAALTQTGTWTLLVNPVDSSTGTEKMVLSVFADPAPRAVALGQAIKVSATAPGMDTDLTFPAQTGKRIVVTTSASSWTSRTGGAGAVYAEFVDPATGEIGSGVKLPSSASGAVDLPASPVATGTWTLRINPEGDSVGSVTVKLSTVTDVTGSIAIGGAPVSVTTTKPFQHVRLALNSGDTSTAEIQVTGSTYPSATFTMTLAKDGGFVDSQSLDQPGDGSVLISTFLNDTDLVLDIGAPDGAAGSMTVKLVRWS